MFCFLIALTHRQLETGSMHAVPAEARRGHRTVWGRRCQSPDASDGNHYWEAAYTTSLAPRKFFYNTVLCGCFKFSSRYV